MESFWTRRDSPVEVALAEGSYRMPCGRGRRPIVDFALEAVGGPLEKARPFPIGPLAVFVRDGPRLPCLTPCPRNNLLNQTQSLADRERGSITWHRACMLLANFVCADSRLCESALQHDEGETHADQAV